MIILGLDNAGKTVRDIRDEILIITTIFSPPLSDFPRKNKEDVRK